jgi:hydroxymethylglutaryl-CoA reductase (NADPH)
MTTEPNLKDGAVFLNAIATDKNWTKKLQTKKPLKLSIPRGYGLSQIEERWKLLNSSNEKYQEYAKKNADYLKTQPDYKTPMEELFDPDTKKRCDLFKDNIENMIGTVKVPLGIAGPIRVNGLFAQGDYFVPLATTEAALVASINRGISVMNASGGCTSVIVQEGISRDPLFGFKDLIELGTFLSWAAKNFEIFQKEASKSTKHGKLIECKYTIEGNQVHMKCVYTTGDASGQNIVTLATENIINYIEKNSPVKPTTIMIEGGMSGDKKANAASLSGVRGKRVVAEVKIPKDIIWSQLHASPLEMAKCAEAGSRGLWLNGTLGLNMHFANPITAMAIALGQDPACAAESHVGIARSGVNDDGSLYCSVTCPNLLVATVGGGTKLPSQRACLELMGLVGNGCANALAEVMAGVVLAAEISLGSAIVSGDFAKAHKILARDSKDPINLEKDSPQEAFEKAQALVVKLSTPPSKEIILNIYGLYKQATSGDVNIERPGFFSTDLKAKAKYDAWAAKKGLTKEKAMLEYVQTVLKLVSEQK